MTSSTVTALPAISPPEVPDPDTGSGEMLFASNAVEHRSSRPVRRCPAATNSTNALRRAVTGFVDTNVLAYTPYTSEPDKQPAARAWMEHLWTLQAGRTSTRVLDEYYVTVTRKLSPGLDRANRDCRTAEVSGATTVQSPHFWTAATEHVEISRPELLSLIESAPGVRSSKPEHRNVGFSPVGFDQGVRTYPTTSVSRWVVV